MRVAVAVLLALLLPDPAPAWRTDTVKTWARELGDELWRLSESLTKSDQIRIKYKQMNAGVKKKDGTQILDFSLRSVSTMLTRKINAVKCIHATAEKLAKEFDYNLTLDENLKFEYCSAKYSNFEYEPGVIPPKQEVAPPRFAVNNEHYLNISLERDSHFYDISVNTNTSCVHVPTNIYYKERDALNAILWSEELNDIFIQNYQSDPSLSWQYFGSSHGILRLYPGMPWNMIKVDTYDCRVMPWYIEAATCSKDVIILFDVSGSMTGFKNYVARRTLEALLSTLSNNDYVNVYTFKNETYKVVSCFDGLVQATKENINTIIKTLENGGQHKVAMLEGNANLTAAYTAAFETLKQKRDLQGCSAASTQGCNQLVMLITDYVPGNLTEVFEEHNREIIDSQTYIPVRVFTFLIGKEVTNVWEITWMACLNRGYFVHIHSVEEVQQQVLKYINVIARPMILKGDEPPPTWTHANIDSTRTKEWMVSTDVDNPDEDKLVTSVAIPAFDYKYKESNDVILLGVAGTDVPIDSIARLAQPHQLGVNGYPFIVSNNGYLLLHPLLITTINGKLQENYNSVDFVEVEQVDDGKGPRELGEEIQLLRKSLVDGRSGNMTAVPVLFHYDNMRRIAQVEHDYFFNKLEGTPFSMGISLPSGYGDTELMLKDNPLEAKQGKELTGINVTDYFRTNFRVHPDWVYCKYHYLEGHEAETPEIEIWRFLVNISRNELNIKLKQYNDTESQTFDSEKTCSGRNLLDKNDYYCTDDLVKQLVFDAKLTTPFFKEWHATDSDRRLAKEYKVDVRFIATSSGLTRWHYIFDPDKNEYVNDDGTREKKSDDQEKVFGDLYRKSIEETWYKAAVLQHMINKESLVIGTRLPILDKTIQNRPSVKNEDGDITVTSSYAIFYKDGEYETPASVVGFQYSYSHFYNKFLNLTKSTTGEKNFVCGEKYYCYLVDSSGYVVLSISPADIEKNYTVNVGLFFGAVNKDTRRVMQFLIDRTVFKYVEVFNYQALCPMSELQVDVSSGWTLTTPFNLAGNFLRWILTELMLFVINWNQYAYAIDDYDIDEDHYTDHTDEKVTTAEPVTNETEEKVPEAEPTFSCDHSIKLYILNQKYFLETMGLPRTIHADVEGECHPPFWASYVPKTNLLLVVVQQGAWYYADNCTEPPDTAPRSTEDSRARSEPCHKLPLGRLYRRPLEGCYTYHEKERNITACGKGSIARADLSTFVFTATLAALASKLFY